jgi:Phage tail protein.
MLNQVEVVSDQGTQIILPIGETSSGFYIEDIDGLDPVAANASSSPFGQLDGEVEQGARREKRNIILTVGLEPDYISRTVSQMRRQLYTYFMPKSKATFRFISDDMEPVSIRGTIEDLDAKLFVQDPKAVISVVNFQPDFLSLVETVINGSTTATGVDTDIVYPGSVDTGFVFQLNVNRSITGFTLNQTLPDSSQRTFQFVYPLVAGDVLTISTIAGNKYATLLRGSTQTSALAGVSPQADWLQLAPGTNKFRSSVTGAAIPYTLKYTSRYGGL